MSDSNVPSTSDNATSAKTEPTAVPVTQSKKGKWRRRLLKAIFGLVLFFIVIRIGLFFLLAITLRKVANFYDLDLVYQRQEITLLGGDAGLWGVKVSRRGESEPFLEADYVHGNLSVLALLRTHIEIWRMEADGVLLDITRTPDGKIPLLDLVMAQMSGTPVAKTTPDNTPLDLSSPFKIDALRLHRFRAKISDLAVQPAFNETLYADVRVSDLRNPEKPTSIEADVWSDSVLTAMRFNGTGTAEGRVVNLEAMFRGGGLNLGPVAQYLKPLGLNPVARSIDWNGKLKLSTDAGPTPTSITAKLNLSNVSATADTREVVFLKSIDVAARSIDVGGVALSTLRVDGVRVRADRATNGRLRFAGIELVPAAPPPPPATVPASPRRILIDYDTPATQPATLPATRPASSPALVTLDELILTNLQASFGDEALPTPATIELFLDQLKTQKIGVDSDGRSFLPIDGTFRAPGIIGTGKMQGRLHPFEAPFGADVVVSAQGVQLDALRPYLAPLGITSTLAEAKLTAGIQGAVEVLPDGSAEASLRLKDVVLQDAAQRLKLPLVDVRKSRADLSANRFDLGEIEIVGPELTLVRFADGSLETAGFRYRAVNVDASTVQSPTTTQPADSQIVLTPPLPDDLPIVTLKKLDWHRVKISVEDQSTEQPNHFVVEDIGAELTGIVFNLSRNRNIFGNGELRAWASLPGLLGRIDVRGDTSCSSGDFSARANIDAKQISLIPLAPYLAPLGLKPTMTDGNFEASAHLTLRGVSDSIRHELVTTVGGQIELNDGNRWLLSVPMAEARDIVLHPTWVFIRGLESQAAQVRLFRNADGTFEACGLQFVPPKKSSTPEPVAGGPLIPIPRVPIPFFLDVGVLSAFSVDFEDHTFALPIKTRVALAGNFGSIRPEHQDVLLQQPEDKIGFSFRMFLSEQDETNVSGLLRLEDDSLAASVEVHGTGLSAAQLEPYLPAGFVPTLDAGTLNAKAELSLRNLDGTAQQLDLTVTDVLLRQDNDTLAKLDRFAVQAARIDLANNRIDIDAVESAGALVRTGVGTDMSLRLPGVQIEPSIEPAEDVAKPDAPIEVSAGTSNTSDDELARQLALARKPLPLMTIGRLNLGVEHAGVVVDSLGANTELAIKSLQLTNTAPIQIGGEHAADLPPVNLKIVTELSPLVKQVEINVAAAPFANEATVVGTLDAKQINGQGLLELVPEIASLVDGSSLTEGSLKASLDAKLRVARRTPTEFDLRRGFEGEIKLADIAYRTKPDAEPEAGVESITMEGVRVQPAFAGGTVKLLTVNKPLARVLRDKEGIHVLGWTIKLPAAGDEAATQSTDETARTDVPNTEMVQAEAKPQAAPPGPEFKIDKLLISGSDVLIRDVSVEPALVVPINALDVEVKGLSNRALVEDRTIRFSALVGADKVEMPTRAKRGEVASAATEMRPLMSQVAATGNLRLFPAMDGYVKASVNGFEMQSLIGEAKAFDITLGDGIFDGTFDARFRDGGNLDLKTKLVVTDLKLSEQPNGLMQRTFKLPVPLDAAIGLVEDTSGSITLPVNAKIRAGEVDMGSIIGSVIGGVTEICAKAIASAPLKMLQGFGGEAQAEAPKPPVVLTFLPGDTSLEPSLRKSLDELIVAMKKDANLNVTLSHKLSSLDAKRAGVLASPTQAQIESMTGELRTRRMVLINQRAVSAAGFSAELASGSSSPAGMSALQQLDRQIVANDDALERLLDLTRPGAELQGDRRMKAAAIDIGTARLAIARAYLDAAKIERMSERLSVTNPRFEIDDSLEAGGIVSIEQIVKKRAK